MIFRSLMLAMAVVSSSASKFKRLGMLDEDVGESSAVTLNGRPYLLESTSSCYPNHARLTEPAFKYCPSYLRVVDLTTGNVVSNLTSSCNHTFGSAMVTTIAGKETMYVFSSRWARFQSAHPWCPSPKGPKTSWTGQCGATPKECTIDAFASSDLKVRSLHVLPPLLLPPLQAADVSLRCRPGAAHRRSSPAGLPLTRTW